MSIYVFMATLNDLAMFDWPDVSDFLKQMEEAQ
jgi:hypothetical protein